MQTPSLARRSLLPALVLIVTVLGSITVFAGSSKSSASSSPVLISASVSAANQQAVAKAAATPPAAYQTGRFNSGTPHSSKRLFINGKLVAYGSTAITYVSPPSALNSLGEALYQQNCASCHGTQANGVPANGTPGAFPNLRGLGPATIDFWVATGRMPAADPNSVQAQSRSPRFNQSQALAIAGYVNSLSPATPFVPVVRNLSAANVSNGFALYALNCAACHTITGGGDELAKSTFAPTLRLVAPTQIAEAIRTGPGNMPRFTGNLSDAQVRDIVGYVSNNIQHPVNVGGIGLGGLGPVGEGFVALAIGIGALLLVAFWIGDRT
jgi:ubiquinol-cytochrome c reductase cytochrome c subunit